MRDVERGFFGKEEERRRSKNNEQEIGDGREKMNGHARRIEEIREDGLKRGVNTG